MDRFCLILPDGREIEIRRKIPMNLLSRLAVAPGLHLDRKTLIEELWPDSYWENGSNRLSVAVYQLRQELAEFTGTELIHTKGDQIALDLNETDIDFHALRKKYLSVFGEGSDNVDLEEIYEILAIGKAPLCSLLDSLWAEPLKEEWSAMIQTTVFYLLDHYVTLGKKEKALSEMLKVKILGRDMISGLEMMLSWHLAQGHQTEALNLWTRLCDLQNHYGLERTRIQETLYKNLEDILEPSDPSVKAVVFRRENESMPGESHCVNNPLDALKYAQQMLEDQPKAKGLLVLMLGDSPLIKEKYQAEFDRMEYGQIKMNRAMKDLLRENHVPYGVVQENEKNVVLGKG